MVARFRRRSGCRVGRGGGVEVDAEQGVVVGQGAQRDGMPVAVPAAPALLGLLLGLLLGAALFGQCEAHLVGGGDVGRVGDHHVAGPAAGVAGGGVGGAGRPRPGGGGGGARRKGGGPPGGGGG